VSHRIIIMNARTATGAAIAEDVHGVTSLSVEYTPDHARTEAQVGQDVAKILRLTKKIEAVGTAEEAPE